MTTGYTRNLLQTLPQMLTLVEFNTAVQDFWDGSKLLVGGTLKVVTPTL